MKPITTDARQLENVKVPSWPLLIQIDDQFDDDVVVSDEVLAAQIFVRETQADALVIISGHWTLPVPRRTQHLR